MYFDTIFVTAKHRRGKKKRKEKKCIPVLYVSDYLVLTGVIACLCCYVCYFSQRANANYELW